MVLSGINKQKHVVKYYIYCGLSISIHYHNIVPKFKVTEVAGI